MMRFFQFILRYKKTAALLLCALAATAVFFFNRPHHHIQTSTNPDITTPAFAVEAMQAWNPKSVYFTVSAYNYLAQKKPEWISPYNTQQGLLDLYQAGQDPAHWRRLDHQYHFDAVMLCGDPSEYLPLLEHLIVTKDWTLVYLDHTSIIFRRAPVKGWTFEDFRALQQKFANYAPIDRAAYLNQSASKLLAIGERDLAKVQLDQSFRIDPDSPDAWTQMALYELQVGDANKALEATDRALKLDENYYSALTARAKILFSAKHFGEALVVSTRLKESHPDDQGVLFFHSMIAHEAHAFTEEIQTLQHLIEIAISQKQPVAGFRIYLGQAYARDGQADPALDEFQKALDEGNLSDEQRKFIQDTMTSIKGGTLPP